MTSSYQENCGHQVGTIAKLLWYLMGHPGIYPRLTKMQTWFSVTIQIEAQRQTRGFSIDDQHPPTHPAFFELNSEFRVQLISVCLFFNLYVLCLSLSQLPPQVHSSRVTCAFCCFPIIPAFPSSQGLTTISLPNLTVFCNCYFNNFLTEYFLYFL